VKKVPAITVLDGGLGQELLARCSAPATGLWSAQLLIDRPDLVRAVHTDFLYAGADVITTNSYMLQRDRLAPFGVAAQFEKLQRQAAQIAVDARDAFGAGLIAGSMGPIGRSYRPDLALHEDEAAERYAEIARLQAPYVDLFLCETMSSVQQARGAVMGAQVAGKPVWLSITVDDQDGRRLRSGETVTDILPVCEALGLDTILVNCSPPEAVGQAVAQLVGHGLTVGGYANGFARIAPAFLQPGATVAALEKRKDLGPSSYAVFVEGWVRSGARIVGGCCEVGPKHIRLLAQRFKADSHDHGGCRLL
jgi:S-methylmethionine-dependent homocysteine/selenocysteine methylase